MFKRLSVFFVLIIFVVLSAVSGFSCNKSSGDTASEKKAVSPAPVHTNNAKTNMKQGPLMDDSGRFRLEYLDFRMDMTRNEVRAKANELGMVLSKGGSIFYNNDEVFNGEALLKAKSKMFSIEMEGHSSDAKISEMHFALCNKTLSGKELIDIFKKKYGEPVRATKEWWDISLDTCTALSFPGISLTYGEGKQSIKLGEHFYRIQVQTSDHYCDGDTKGMIESRRHCIRFWISDITDKLKKENTAKDSANDSL